MATLVLRNVKGSPLTSVEVDANFTNLNDELATKLDGSGGQIDSDLVINGTLGIGSGLTTGDIDTDLSIDMLTDTGGIGVPVGDDLDRPSTPAAGMFRFNTDINAFEGYNGTAWGAVGGGASGAANNYFIYENDQTVTGDYTMTSGKNGMTAGPIAIDDGVTVTIPDGSYWTVV
jgi:hypothetical protein